MNKGEDEQALEARATLTEAEIAKMKDEIKAKKALVKSWRQGLCGVYPETTLPEKKGGGSIKVAGGHT